MRQLFIIAFVVFFNTNSCFAQDSIKWQNRSQRSLFVELAGNSVYMYNITYDYSYKIAQKHKIAAGIGGQCMPFDGEIIHGIYSQINYLYGRTHHLELGIGYSIEIEGTYVNDLSKLVPIRMGYRYQKDEGGFFCRVAFVALYCDRFLWLKEEFDWFRKIPLLPWGGIAFGYTFKNKD